MSDNTKVDKGCVMCACLISDDPEFSTALAFVAGVLSHSSESHHQVVNSVCQRHSGHMREAIQGATKAVVEDEADASNSEQN